MNQAQPEVNNDGRIIDSAVTSSDNVDHILQANALKNIQNVEMNNDLQRMKEVTQNGLREMFSNAVNKQQLFMNQMQGQEVADSQQQSLSPQFSSQGGPNLLPNGMDAISDNNQLLANNAQFSGNFPNGLGEASNIQLQNGAAATINNQLQSRIGRFPAVNQAQETAAALLPNNAEVAADGQLFGVNGVAAGQLMNTAEDARNDQVLSNVEDAAARQLPNDFEEAGNSQLLSTQEETAPYQLPNGAQQVANGQLTNNPEQVANGQLVNSPEQAANGQYANNADETDNGQFIVGAEAAANGQMPANGQLTDGFINNEENADQGLDVNNNERRSRIRLGNLPNDEEAIITDFLSEE